jgi:hypothetical protein
MLELTLDRPDGCITEVATSSSLPGYTRLLRRLLIGQQLDAVEGIAQGLCAHYRGPLLKPTIAALRSAARPLEQIGVA